MSKPQKKSQKSVDKVLEVYNGSVFTVHAPKPTQKSIHAIVASTSSADTNVTHQLNEIRK